MRIDLNADIGEGAGDDAELLRHVSSASIACGGHAGDEASMRAALRACAALDVAAGAHPSHVDRAHFGRRAFDWRALPLAAQLGEQIDALQQLARAEGVMLRHVKPHGSLYNQAAQDAELADLIAAAVRRCDPGLALVGLAGSALPQAATRAGLRAIHEAFADRAYLDATRLVPRSEPGAVLLSAEFAAEQVLRVVRDCQVRDRQGRLWPLRADSFCVHGDAPGAASFAAALRLRLAEAGVTVRRPDANHAEGFPEV